MSTERLTWHSQHKKTLDRGARAADLMRNGMGSWPFVGTFLAIMAVWAVLNTVGLDRQLHWDPYPFILLNLFLSMLAGLQGAILLIAAKRQDAIAAALAQHDYDTDVSAKADIGLLMALNERQLEMIMDLRLLVTGLHDDRSGDPAPAAQ
ncbi:DUF1003 domain-containing protein [Cryobacterium tagatosivorans]|uniref:DUF1003 domain-containing protein n=1 Tax=Cryobacterium tagatosivorans TaxID=1259199 RepID=A0A4R8UF32_9MICO|nr:DUF1003 domain-containing protein [Cryobacterium tagatosivorans]TFB51336.1 DUF1003 domain-containing protein [Cryobacterium tagatosivorans]